MRIISFTEMWPKLQQKEFTTWRFPRRDKDYFVGEMLQLWYRQRSADRQLLGYAQVIAKRSKWLVDANGIYISIEEAQADGFDTPKQMFEFLEKQHGNRVSMEEINVLTLRRFGVMKKICDMTEAEKELIRRQAIKKALETVSQYR